MRHFILKSQYKVDVYKVKITGQAARHLLRARGKFVSEFAQDAAVGGDDGVSP